MNPECENFTEGERDMCRYLLVVAIKDAVTNSNKQYDMKCKRDALRWLKSDNEIGFSFINVVSFLFGDRLDHSCLRNRILQLIKEKSVVADDANIERLVDV